MKTPHCLYCGALMHLKYKGFGRASYAQWECTHCYAGSPPVPYLPGQQTLAKDTATSLALETSIKNAPIGREQIHEIITAPWVFLEYRIPSEDESQMRVCAYDGVVEKKMLLTILGETDRFTASLYDYDRTWRLWADPPTTAECLAAAWIN